MVLRKRLYALLLIGALVFATSACGSNNGGDAGTGTDAAADTPNEKISLVIGGGHPANTMSYTSIAQSFFQTEVQKRCAEEAGLDIEWVEAYGGTVASLAEALVATQNGLIDVCVGSFAFDTKKLFLMNMPYYVPFSSSDPRIATQAFRAVIDQFPEVYDGLWAQYNSKLLGLGPAGSYKLYVKFPVTKAEDINGHKIGGASAMLRWIENLGAITVQSSFTEAYTNLQTGVFEGYYAWPDACQGYKFYEQAPNMLDINFGSMAIQGIYVNLDSWAKLNDKAKEIFIEVGREYEEKSSQAAYDWDSEALEQMKQEGLKVLELDEEAQLKIEMACDNLPNEWIKEADSMGYPAEDLIKAYIKAQEDLGHKFNRDWMSE